MRELKPFFLSLAMLCAFASTSHAQDLVYRATNPAFGGDTFNYNWLLASAQAQDLTEDTRDLTSSFNTRSSVDDLASNLQRQALNALSRELIDAQFGEDTGLTDGTYEFGDFQLDVSTTLEGLSITIFDVAQGEQTQIVIPFF